MNNGTIVVCADVIALCGGKLVLVERLGSQRGLAFPGGKQDPGERLSATAVREMREETGLVLSIDYALGTYAADGRDPRGRFVSTVFVGQVAGMIRAETGKTRVVLLDPLQLWERRHELLFDHAGMFAEYLCCEGLLISRVEAL